MIFGDRPRIIAAEGDKIRIGYDAAGHMDLVRFYKETTNNGWSRDRSMQLMAIVPPYVYGWMMKFHPDWGQSTRWDDHPLKHWLETDDFGRACRVAEDHPAPSGTGLQIIMR